MAPAALGLKGVPKNCRVFRLTRFVGHGQQTYRAVRDAALGWEAMHENSKWAGICLLNYEHNSLSNDRDSNVSAAGALPNVLQIGYGPGAKKLVTYAKSTFFNIWTINPCMVVYDVVDMRQRGGRTYSSTAYGTLRGHLIKGEERVSVCHRDSDGAVEVEVLSISLPGRGILGQMVFPFIGSMQKKFFQEQVDTLERIAKRCL